MADPPHKPEEKDPVRQRRSLAEGEQVSTVTYTRKGLTEERLTALREFLKHAKSDEIAAVRKLYGDEPEVLRLIGLEVLPRSLEETKLVEQE